MDLVNVEGMQLRGAVYDAPVLQGAHPYRQHRDRIHRESLAIDVETVLIFSEHDGEIRCARLKLRYLLLRYFPVNRDASCGRDLVAGRIGGRSAYEIRYHHGRIGITCSSSIDTSRTQL